MQKITAVVAVLGLFAVTSIAETITNRGEVIEVHTLTGDPQGNTTAVKDISKVATQHDRSGLIVAEFDFSVDGTAVTTDLYARPINGYGVLPKGAIIMPGGFIEVTSALPASYATNNLFRLGADGVSGSIASTSYLKQVLPASTGVYAISPLSTLDAASAAGQLNFYTLAATNALSSGKLTVYLPYVLGHEE